MSDNAERVDGVATERYYVSLDHEHNGLVSFEQDTVHGRTTVRASYYVREREAGAPIATAGGQRDSLRLSGPFASRDEANSSLAEWCARDAEFEEEVSHRAQIWGITREQARAALTIRPNGMGPIGP
jgi:hypothetical protein